MTPEMKWNRYSRQRNVTITFLQVPLAAVFHFNSPYFTFKLPCGRQHNIQYRYNVLQVLLAVLALPLSLSYFSFKRPCGREETIEEESVRIVACNVPRIPHFQRQSSAQGCCVCTRPSEAHLLTKKGRRKTASPTRLTLHARGSSGFRRAQRSETSIWN